MFESVKTTPVYKLYRQSLIYDSVRKRGKVLKRAIKLPRYLGTEYRCPICGTGLRAFRPMWKSYWRDVEVYQPIHPAESMETLNLEAFTCPCCDAFDRDRLTAIYLENAFASFDRNRTYRLLEFAPGDALYKKLKSLPFIAYRSADLSRKTVDERVDMTDMAAYTGGSLDVILCSHILEHIPDDRKAMRELRRVLKPEGFAIVLVPLVVGVDETHEDPSMDTPELRWKYFGMGDHVRQYGKRDFIERLEAAGLKVEQLGIEHFGAETFRRAAIAENSVLYVVRPR
ncbi:MAG TPA: class I SAM-dependent methyltransferase [Xanthobacteraceae bacterium]|nr:class I SAM-dependent methyltransferase [Xanthobacteraceae bacterium]